MWVLVLLLLAATTTAQASVNGFVQQRAYDPVTLQVGLPVAASRISSRHQLQMSVEHSNTFSGGRNADELLLFDAETSQASLSYRVRIGECWQFNIDTWWIAHTAGYFDNALDRWHRAFGLPNASRDKVEHGQLKLQYRNDNRPEDEVRLTTSASGIGDAQLQVQRSLGCLDNASILRAGIKLPFGDPHLFTGSGKLDGFVDWQSPWITPSAQPSLAMAASAGILFGGKPTHLSEQNPYALFGIAGLNYDLGPRWQLLAQFDWHSPLFKTDLTEIGSYALQLTLGARIKAASGSAFEFSFAEDISVDTAPDIAVRFGWSRAFF